MFWRQSLERRGRGGLFRFQLCIMYVTIIFVAISIFFLFEQRGATMASVPLGDLKRDRHLVGQG